MSATASQRTKSASPASTGECAPADGVDYGALNQRIGYVLRRAQIAVFRDFFAAFEAFDIRPAQYSILTLIERNPGRKQSEVSEALGIQRTNFVAMIDELQRRGLVRRDAAPNDRRSYALMLTEEGRRLMGELHEEAERHEQRMADAIGADAHERMFADLKKLAKLDEDRRG